MKSKEIEEYKNVLHAHVPDWPTKIGEATGRKPSYVAKSFTASRSRVSPKTMKLFIDASKSLLNQSVMDILKFLKNA